MRRRVPFERSISYVNAWRFGCWMGEDLFGLEAGMKS